MAWSDDDPYLDPVTGVLRNKLGLTTNVALEHAEGDLVFAALVELLEDPPPGTGDLAEWQAIHRYLFEDLYDWAGQTRKGDFRKPEQNEPFLPWQHIAGGAEYAARELHADDDLRGMDRGRFIERLAYHYDAFNYVHPFREGNGRTQRVFWNRVARDAGWELDWRLALGSVNDHASRVAAEDRNFLPLLDMFDRITAPAPLRRAGTWAQDEAERVGVPDPIVNPIHTSTPTTAPVAVSTSAPDPDPDPEPSLPELIRQFWDPYDERATLIEGDRVLMDPSKVLENTRARMERIDLAPGTPWSLEQMMSWEEMAILFAQLRMGPLIVTQTAEYARQILSRWPSAAVRHPIPPQARIEDFLPGIEMEAASQDLGRRVINRALASPDEIETHPELREAGAQELMGAWLAVLFWYTIKSGTLHDRFD
jgi:cell filamentation protein